MRYQNFFLIILLMCFINGCTTMNSKFTCKTPDGVMCQSLDDVNGMVDRGELGQNSGSIDSNKKPFSFMPIVWHSPPHNAPLRSGESVMRIWAAPYEDNSGNYHEASVFYTVIKSGHWNGAPPKEIAG